MSSCAQRITFVAQGLDGALRSARGGVVEDVPPEREGGAIFRGFGSSRLQGIERGG